MTNSHLSLVNYCCYDEVDMCMEQLPTSGDKELFEFEWTFLIYNYHICIGFQ